MDKEIPQPGTEQPPSNPEAANQSTAQAIEVQVSPNEVIQPTLSNPSTTPTVGNSVQVSAPETKSHPVKPMTLSANSQMLQEEQRSHLRRIVIWLLVIFILVVGLAALASNQDLRTKIYKHKFVTYNYLVCSNFCNDKLYRGSKIASLAPATASGEAQLSSTTVGNNYLSIN